MDNGFNLSIPKTLRGVKLHQWVKFMEVYEKNKDNESSEFLDKKMIEILCEVSLKDLSLIPIASFDTVLAHLYDVLNTEVDLVNTFKMKGSDGVEVEFGIIPNLDKMTYGEWEDLENYIFDQKNIHRAMAVLYRPLIYQIGGKYRVHPYQGTDFYADLMKEMPVDIALGARVFFLSFSEKIRELYNGLYTQTVSAGAERGQGLSQAFGKKWGGYQAIYALAEGDVRRIDEVTKLPLHQCLMFLEFVKEKNELENKLIKQSAR